MTMYEKIFEKLQERINSGELTLEDANRLNDYAYNKYVVEAEESSNDEELVNSLLQKVEDGFKLPKKLKEAINEVLSDDESNEDDESDDKEDNESDDKEDDEE